MFRGIVSTNMTLRAASPTKKARHAVPSPPSTPPHQIKKLSFDVEDDDDNPFIDKAASDVQEDDNTAYKTTTLRNVIGECVARLSCATNIAHLALGFLGLRNVQSQGPPRLRTTAATWIPCSPSGTFVCRSSSTPSFDFSFVLLTL